jgi:drug/metabolite transporter (DMT)-like permease
VSERHGALARPDVIGGLLAVGASVQFGAIVVIGKRVLERGMLVESMLAYRFGVAAIVLAGTVVALGRPLVAVRGERLGLAALAFFGYAVEATFFFTAADHGTAAAVTLLFFTYPVFVTLGAWAFGRGAPARLTVLALFLALAGSAIVVATGSGLSIETFGVVFSLAAAATYSAYLVGTDLLIRRTSPLTGAVWVSAGASTALFLYTAVAGRHTVPSGAGDWWAILAMGVATAGAFVCLLGAIRHIGAVRTSIVAATEPLSAAILGFVFLDEAVHAGTAAGGLLILLGAIAASLARAATPQEQQVP